MPEVVDVTIIGAGVIGLAIAAELADGKRKTYLLEKNETFGQEQSSRNSEVIHCGILSRKGSLRAELCLEGNRLLYELCENYGVPYRRCGKIFVATSDSEVESLERMFQAGIDGGVQLQMLSQREMRELEPNMKADEAFFSPTSGIVDSYALMRYFLSKARGNGAHIFYNSEVTGIEKVPEGYRVWVNNRTQDTALLTRLLINCAGLYSDRISELAGIDIDRAEYGIRWGKGEYYSISGIKKGMLNTLIYPVPDGIGPGIHTCMDIEGRLRLGPLFYWVDEIDYKIDDSRRAMFEESSIMKALPFIEPSGLEPESTGIMVYPKQGIKRPLDYLIRDESEYGLNGFINLVDMGSPGLTAAPAIAGYVRWIVDEIS